MAKKIDFTQLPVMEQQEGDTVAAYRKGRVVRIPAGAGGGSTPLPDLAAVATTGKYSDLLNKPTLGTAASKDSTAFATAEQGTKADTAYSWGDHSQAGYAQASAVASALSSKVDRVSGASLYPDADAVKLGGIASGATKNATDAQLRDRGSHTGTQSVSTITGLASVATSGKYADLTDKPTIPSSSDVSKGVTAHGWGNHAEAGYVKTNTTYATGTLAQLNAGTDTTGRLQTAKNLNDWLANKGYATTDTTYTASTGLDLSGTAFSVKYGTAAGTAAQGNDSRINNGQTAYGWGNHASAGYAVASSVNTALSAKVDKVAGKDLSANDFTNADKGKLDGVAAGATKNATDAHLLNRANHTGTQPHTTITGLGSASTRNVGEIAGNVMGVGAFGLGAVGSIPNPLSDDIDRGDRAIGFYSWRGSAEGALPPVNDKNGALIHTGYRTGGTGSPFAFQLAASNMDIGLFFRQLRGGNGWTPWREMIHTGNFTPSNYYTKTQTDAVVAGATSGSNVWQSATTALIKNAYNKVAFPSPKTLTLPANPAENDYVAILVIDGDMKGSTIARNGKTIMEVAEDMTIDMKTPYLRLDYVASSWRIAS